MIEERVIDIFARESGEALETVLSLVLDLEDARLAPDAVAGHLVRLQRVLHGVKGGAMVVGLAPVGALFHAAEDYLATSPRDRALTPDEVDPLVTAVDLARRLIAAAVSGTALALDVEPTLRALRRTPVDPEVDPEIDETSAPEEAPADDATPGVEDDRRGESVRVDIADVDALVRSLGSLTTLRAALACRVASLEALLAPSSGAVDPAALRAGVERVERDLRQDEHRLARVVKDAQGRAARLKMVPFGGLLETSRRAVRDLRRRTGKDARLAFEGGDVLLDKRALDALRVPLLHLVRNAVDHGLEDAPRRRACGKPAQGEVRVAAAVRGARVVVTVADDGGGLDEPALRARAAALGLDEGASLLDVLAAPGLSTKDVATEVSGRGVGLGAVRKAVDDLGGRLEVQTTAGAGSRFVISLPPTLATRKALLVEEAGQRFCVPSASVVRLLRARVDELVEVDGCPATLCEGVPLRIVPLRRLLGLSAAPQDDRRRYRQLLLVDAGALRLAVEVDRVVEQLEVVVLPLRHPVVRVRGIEGVTVHGDGTALPVLDVVGLSASATTLGGEAPRRREAPRILVVDDSITTQTLERTLFQGAGMEVVVASDGREALGLVQEGGRFDLVVSDIEMPRMDGITLVRELRKVHSKQALPIVLVSSVTKDAVRAAGLESGANALVVKQSFDPEYLLSVIGALLADPARAARG